MPSDHLLLTIWAVGMLVIWPPSLWWVVRSRRAQGFDLMARTPADQIFAEKGASGSEAGKLGGASNCLLVAVTPREFIITPNFPFSLIAAAGGPIGLVHRAPRSAVSASATKSWRGGNVRVEVEKAAKRVVMDLKLRDPHRFLAALR